MKDKEFDLIKKLLPPELFDPDFKEKALAHFRKLLAEVEKGSEEEKQEAKQMLEEYAKGQQRTHKKLAEMLGVNENDLRRILTNPQNYSKEEWENLQEGTKEMKPVINAAESKAPSKKKGKKKNKNWTKS